MTITASTCKARDVDSASIFLWDAAGGNCVNVLKGGHKSSVAALAFNSTGQLLASSGKDRRLCVWKRGETNVDYALHAAVDSAHKRIVWDASWHPVDENILASGGRDGFLRFWRFVGDEKKLVKLAETKFGESVNTIAFAPGDCNVIAVGLFSGAIELWKVGEDYGSLELMTKLQSSHVGTVKKLAWRPKIGESRTMILASCSIDECVQIFEINE